MHVQTRTKYHVRKFCSTTIQKISQDLIIDIIKPLIQLGIKKH